MSKFKSHREQSNINGSDYLLADTIKDSQFIKTYHDRTHDVVELKKLTSILEDLKIKYWLDFGSLLGSYRNKKVITHETHMQTFYCNHRFLKKSTNRLELVSIMCLNKNLLFSVDPVLFKQFIVSLYMSVST